MNTDKFFEAVAREVCVKDLYEDGSYAVIYFMTDGTVRWNWEE